MKFIYFLCSILISMNVNAIGIATKSAFMNRIQINPAAAKLGMSQRVFALSLDQGEGTIEQGGVERYESERSNVSFIGHFPGAMFIEAEFVPNNGKNYISEQNGSSASTAENTERVLAFNFATSGLSYKFAHYAREQFTQASSEIRAGVGNVTRFGSANVGYGVDIAQESGDAVPETRWVEYYAAVGLGRVSGGSGYQAEIGYYHTPEINQYDGDKYKNAPQTRTFKLGGELALGKLKLGLVHDMITELATEGFNDSDVSASVTNISIGYALSSSTDLLVSQITNERSSSSDNTESERILKFGVAVIP